MKTSKTFQVTYTKAIGGEGTILVKAQNENQAITNARNVCASGSDFRNALETDQAYIKPKKQGFAGR